MLPPEFSFIRFSEFFFPVSSEALKMNNFLAVSVRATRFFMEINETKIKTKIREFLRRVFKDYIFRQFWIAPKVKY